MWKKLIAIFILLLTTSSLHSTIAVFPFEDLSKDLNGLDLKVSTFVADKLVDMGYDVVYPMEVMFFLEKKNIPFTGWVDLITAKEIAKVYRSNLILLGTIIEKDKKNLNFILSLRIFSIIDKKLIWGNTSTITKSQQISILDLKHRTFQQLLNETITKVLKNVPQPVLMKAVPKPDIDLENVFLNPKYARTGDKITCRIKLKFSGRRPDSIFLIFMNKKHEVKIFKNEIIYSFLAPSEEKRYPISLEVLWKKPFNFSKKLFLTSFFVDNTPPIFTIKYNFATIFNKEIFFNKFLKIVPVLKKEEKILKWKFKIISENDNVTIVDLQNRGNPPKYFIWKGITSKGAVLPNGKYIIKIILYDLANNKFQQSLKVNLVKTIIPPEIYGSINKKEKKIEINFRHKNHPIEISFERIEVFDKNGNLIATKESSHFIKKIEIFNKLYLDKIIYSLEIKDILGNRIFIKKREIKLEQKKIEQKRNKKIWINEF